MSPPEQPSPHDLRDRCAVVTGAAHGIGRAIADHLFEAGAYVIAVDKDGPALKDHFASDDKAKRCAWIEHDFAQPDEDFSGITNGEALAEKILALAGERSFGPPTLIVNNVGIETPHSFRGLPHDVFDEVQRVNLRTPWHLTRRLVQELQQPVAGTPARPAAILFISSLHDTVPSRRPHYGSSKAAVSQLVRDLAVELGGDGIRVNAVSPGWIRTAPDPNSPEQRTKERALVPRIPVGRPGTPADVARFALLLLSETWSSYVTGVNVPIDGGLSLDTWVPRSDVRSDGNR